MSASQIAISSFYSGAAGIYRTLRYTAETIVGITSLTRIAKVNQRWTVFVVMREGGKIIAPSPYKIKQEMQKIDPHTQKPVIGKDGKPVTEEKEVTIV